MSNLHSDASYINLFNEISTFLSLKGVLPRQTDTSPVTSEESSDTSNNVPAPIHSCGKEPPQGDSQLENEMVYDSTYNNVLVDIPSFNTAKKTENIDESQCKNSSLEDFNCHVSDNNENQNNDGERSDSEPIERMKCTDGNCETHILELCLLQNSNFNENERSSPKDIVSEAVNESENSKRKQSVQNTPQDEERHCSYKGWDGETGNKWKNFGGKTINAAQPTEQQVKTIEKIICCTTDDTKMSDEIQCCQTVKVNTLIDEQHFSTSLSSSEDDFQCSSDAKDTHTYPDIILSKSKVTDKETVSKSHLYTESVQTLSFPDKKSDSYEKICSANKSISSLSDDGEFKTAVAVPIKSTCANNTTVINSINKPMVYSGEIARIPCVAINKALSNFRLKLSNQPKQVYIPSRFLHQYNNAPKSKSVGSISSESNVPILTPISPVMQIYPNMVSASTSSSPQRQTINHIPTSLGVKKEKRKTIVLKSILPSTMKMVAKYVSVSGFSPVASSGIYSNAEMCNQKVQLVGSSLPKITPLILPSTKAAMGNTEVTQPSSSELAPIEIPVAERNMSSLSILPSMPQEFSDSLNISIASQETAVSTVKQSVLSAQELKNKGSMNNPANHNVFIEGLRCHLSTDATASSSSIETIRSICENLNPEISSAENKFNHLPDSDVTWTEDTMVHNKGKEQMVKSHSNSNDMNIGNVQIIRKFKLGSRTTWKRKNKCESVIGMTKIINLVHSTRKNRTILPKCESDIKYKEKPDVHITSSMSEIEQKNKKTTKVLQNNRVSIQRKHRITKNNDSNFPESSTNKPIQNLNNHKIIDNLESKHVYNDCKNEPSKFIANNILQQDLSEKQYPETTSQEYICSPSWMSIGSDKTPQEATFMPHEVNDSNSHPSVFKLPSVVNDHYQSKDAQRSSLHSDRTSSLEPANFPAEHDHSRVPSCSAAYDINADKGFNNFTANNQSSLLHGTFSASINDEKYKTQDLFSSTVHQMVPTSQTANSCLSNADVNIFLNDNKFGNYSTKFNTDDCKTYSNVSENENNWHNRSKEWEYIHQKLSKLSQSNGYKVNINPANKHNAQCQTINDYGNEIGPNIQNSNCVINGEEDNLFFSERNDRLTEPHPSTEQELISFLNYKKHLMEYLNGKNSAKGDGDVQQLQNEAMQKHCQNNENKMISLICKQEKTNMQHFGKCYKRRRKTKGPSKSAIKLEREKPYVCCYCGKSEQYKAILQRHLRLEHAYIPPLSTKI